MKHMGYRWDSNLNVYYYKMNGSDKIVYNYDDLTEIEFEGPQVEEQVLHEDADMVEPDDKNEDPPEWKVFVGTHDNS